MLAIAPGLDLAQTIGALAMESYSLQRGSMSCGELAAVFHADATLECAIVLHGRSPVGMIFRTHVLSAANATADRPVDSVTAPLRLVVDENASIVRLAGLASARNTRDRCDPVVVVSKGGAYAGTVALQQLLVRAAELESGSGSRIDA